MKYKLFCYNIKLFADMPAYVYNVMTMSTLKLIYKERA